MGLSETIVAAIIGALATVTTATIQLVRNRAPEGAKPKKNRMRSLMATIALMIGCVVGGYAWSSLRAVSAKEELRATMRAEFAEQFAALEARQREPRELDEDGNAFPARHASDGTAESLVHLPPCRLDAHPDEVGPVTCSDREAQLVALCATVPSASQTTDLRVLARVPKSESPWQERVAGAPTLGSLHIAEAPVEYAVNVEQRSVCVDVSNWGVEDTLAVRLIVDYSTNSQTPQELTAAAPGAI